MKKENINNKTNCHSQVSLLGISTLFPRPLRERVAVGRVRGFTLVELLITIIIVGVLAAIAVSAYQKTVLKSRFSAVIPPTKTTAEAQEFHYMREGSYATDTEDLDVKLNNGSNTITVSDKRTYKYVMGTPGGAENNHYIVYQKHSKRFAGDIHCEAQKDDARANWLCAESLGGTLLTGSISGSDWLTYLLSGDGNGKFVREDCPAGRYDDNGTCTSAPVGHYADDGELKECPVGTFQDWGGRSFCNKCGPGTYADSEGNKSCTACPAGTYQSEQGSTSCTKCPVGTFRDWGGRSSCNKCSAGTYADSEGSTTCKSCPSGKTSNADHTACI